MRSLSLAQGSGLFFCLKNHGDMYISPYQLFWGHLSVTRHLDDGNVFGAVGEYSSMTDSFFFEGGLIRGLPSLLCFSFSLLLSRTLLYIN